MVAGFACSMQGTVYGVPTRALPQLVVEEDIYMRLSAQEASWFGKLNFNLDEPSCEFLSNPKLK